MVATATSLFISCFNFIFLCQGWPVRSCVERGRATTISWISLYSCNCWSLRAESRHNLGIYECINEWTNGWMMNKKCIQQPCQHKVSTVSTWTLTVSWGKAPASDSHLPSRGCPQRHEHSLNHSNIHRYLTVRRWRTFLLARRHHIQSGSVRDLAREYIPLLCAHEVRILVSSATGIHYVVQHGGTHAGCMGFGRKYLWEPIKWLQHTLQRPHGLKPF